MRQPSVTGLKSITWALALAMVAALAACGDSSSTAAAVPAATKNTAVPIDKTSGANLVNSVFNKDFVYASGAAALGTKASTKVTLSGTNALPTFIIDSTEGKATGSMTFGSCIFVIVESSFASTHPLAKGKTVTVNPCTLDVQTAGKAADGTTTDTPADLDLAGTKSSTTPVSASVGADGTVTVGGKVVGSVPVAVPSGA